MASIKLYQTPSLLRRHKNFKFVSSNKLISKFKYTIFKNMYLTGCQAMKLQEKYYYYYYYYYYYSHIYSNIHQRLL